MRRALVLASLAGAAFGVAGLVRAADAPGPRRDDSPDAPLRLSGKPLTSPADPDAALVAAAVKTTGFWAGAPIGAAMCAECHPDVAAQWSTSAHRFSSFNNPYYRISVEDFRKEQGARASRFCAACHEPMLFGPGPARGEASPVDGVVDVASREAQAGLTCLFCHSTIDTSHALLGNGHLGVDNRDWPTRGGAAHKARLRPAIMGESRFCAACHKVGLTPEVTHTRFFRGQDDYDPWQKSAASGHGAGSIFRPPAAQRCQDCHMPLEEVVLDDAAARTAADGKRMIRSHRFLGAEVDLPHLRGDGATEARLVEQLRGSATLDLYWRDAATVEIVLRARKVGHRFPGGVNDSNQVWVAVEAWDAAGRRLASSGDATPEVDAQAHFVRAQPVDDDARPLALRDPQHIAGVIFDTSLPPSDAQAVLFALPPSVRAKTARVTATLYYRKFSHAYAVRACALVPEPAAHARCLDQPRVAVDTATLERGQAASPSTRDAWLRLLDRGVALAAALTDTASLAEPYLDEARRLRPDRPEPLLALARLMGTLGRTDDAVAFAQRAAELDARHPAAPYLEAAALERAYRQKAAAAANDRLLALLPDDREALAMCARIRGVLGDPRRALDCADRLVAVDPFLDEGHYQRALALGDLGRLADAAQAQQDYLFRRVQLENDLALRNQWRQQHHDPDESVPVHTHTLTPLSHKR